MSYDWGRDERYNYNDRGERTTLTQRAYEQQGKAIDEIPRSSGGGSGSPGSVIAIGGLGLCWVIQCLGQALPLWLLGIIALLAASGTAWLVGKKLRSSYDWSHRAVKAARITIFVALGILLFAMFLDFNGLGYRIFILYNIIFVAGIVLLMVAGLLVAIIRHPIRSILIAGVGGCLIWGFFIAKQPVRSTNITSASRESVKLNKKQRVRSKKVGNAQLPPEQAATSQSAPLAASPVGEVKTPAPDTAVAVGK